MKIFKNQYVVFLYSSVISVATVGCLQYQSPQLGLSSEIYEVVNPKPVNSHPEVSNSAHKILIGVIDSGVDYNHPSLEKSVHYQLDSENKIVGAGWDFYGDDPWPAPYIARTADKSRSAGFEGRSKASQARKLAQRMEVKFPSIASKIDSRRAVEEEYMNGAFHGTHVTGLASFDDQAIGIIPLRVNLGVPQKLNFEKTQAFIDATLKILEAAIAKGYSLGARVFNMSLSMQAILNRKNINSTSDSDSKKASYSKLAQEIFQRNQTRVKSFESFLKNYPDIIIIAASGNSGVFLEEDQVNSLPCGVSSSQVLCVGSTDKDLQQVSGFTNIPRFNVPFILAPGENLLSTFPTMMCAGTMVRTTKGFLPWYLVLLATVSDEENWTQFAKQCQTERRYVLAEGTSMASPMAARAYVRYLLKTNQEPSGTSLNEFIQTLKSISFKDQNFKVVPMTYPSWSSGLQVY